MPRSWSRCSAWAWSPLSFLLDGELVVSDVKVLSDLKVLLAGQLLAVRLDIAGKAERVIARPLLGELGVARLQCFDDGQMFRQRGRDAVGPSDRELPVAAHVEQDVIG